MDDKDGDGGEGGNRVSVNEWNNLIKGPFCQVSSSINNVCCHVAESIVVESKSNSELDEASGELGMGSIEPFRLWELFGPEGRDGSRWCGSDNGDRDGGGGVGAGDIEIKVELGYLFFQVLDSFMGGELCTGCIPLMSYMLDEDGDVVK